MIEKLVEDVFNKAKKHCSSHNRNALSKHIVGEIEKEFNLRLTKETLTRAYDKYVSKTKPKNSSLSKTSIKFLCNYLGCNDYKEYVELKNTDLKEVEAEKIKNKFSYDKLVNSKAIEKQKNVSQLNSNAEEQPKKQASKKKTFVFSFIIILIFIIVGLFINQHTSPFSVKFNILKKPEINLHLGYPKLGEIEKAVIKFYLPTGFIEREVGANSELTLTNLPYSFSEQKIKVELKDKFWRLSKDSIILKRKQLTLKMEPNESLSKIEGEVLTHIGGLPIENATVNTEGLEGITDKYGIFSIPVPLEKRKLEYELSIYKEGFKNYRKLYFSGAKTQIRLVTK